MLVAGDDIDEPVADETMSLLDGHVLLSRALAARGRYPAVGVVRSKSRMMEDVVGAAPLAAAQRLIRVVTTHERHYDKISCNIYELGTDPEIDEAIERIGDAERFLSQGRGEAAGFAGTVERLTGLLG